MRGLRVLVAVKSRGERDRSTESEEGVSIGKEVRSPAGQIPFLYTRVCFYRTRLFLPEPQVKVRRLC